MQRQPLSNRAALVTGAPQLRLLTTNVYRAFWFFGTHLKKVTPIQEQALKAKPTTGELIRQARLPSATLDQAVMAVNAIEADGLADLREMGDVMKIASDELITKLTSDALLIQEVLRRNCAQMMKALAQPTDGPLEQTLIRQVVLCWLRLAAAERTYTNSVAGQVNITLAEYWEKRLSATQKRYLKACESLARVRKLLKPSGPQVSVGDVNMLVNGVPLNEAVGQMAVAGLRSAMERAQKG
jgi:hypothetical protein